MLLPIGPGTRSQQVNSAAAILKKSLILGDTPTGGKTIFIVGHLCPEKNYDNIVATHDTQ